MKREIDIAVDYLKESKYTAAFTGAGISVESGIPPFRGADGIWSKYDPELLVLDRFYARPKESWTVIKEIFFDYFGEAQPNKAHKVLAQMEQKNLLKCVITQNIDNLHQKAGNKEVYEFHGNSHSLLCTKCSERYPVENVSLDNLPPVCHKCGGVLKPDFIFFGEAIPRHAYDKSVEAASKAEVMLIVGSTGEVIPASNIPFLAKENGATIIEVNPSKSNFTDSITDVYLKGKASEIMHQIGERLLIK